jgi:hypothetical protein
VRVRMGVCLCVCARARRSEWGVSVSLYAMQECMGSGKKK